MISPQKSPFIPRHRASMSNDNAVDSTKCKKTRIKGHVGNVENCATKLPKEEKKSKLKELVETGISFDNSMSSIGSKKSKADTTKISNKETKNKKNLTKDKKVMESLHASYGSLGTGSFSSLMNVESDNDSDEEFATPRQSLTSPSKSSWKNKMHQNDTHGSPGHRKIMAPPLSPLSVQTSKHRQKQVMQPNCKESSVHDSNSSLSNSASFEEFSTPRQSPWKTTQRKKTIIPNPRDPTHVKTIFLQDCSDSSDSDRESPKREKRKAFTNKKVKCKATKKCLSNGENSIHNDMTKKKIKKQSKVYGKHHVKAANIIAAFVRGHIERLKFKLKRLQTRLDNMEMKTINEIADMYVEYEILKAEWREKAQDRYQKNLLRQDRSLTVAEAHDLIQKIRVENTDFRERNRMLLEDVQKLKINNERLEAANRASNEFMDRIVYHEDSCSNEHAKLVKINSQYEKAIKEHEEHLALHIAFGECEHNAKMKYCDLLKEILDILEIYKETDSQFVEDIKNIACQIDFLLP